MKWCTVEVTHTAMDTGYPKLVVGKLGDGFWERFVRDMDLAIETVTDRRGTEIVDGAPVNVVRGRRKLVPLLRAIGDDGCEVLTGAGFVLGDAASTYEGAMAILQAHFGVQETMFVRGQRFLTASQTLGESNWEFMKRVEKLSRKANIHLNNEEVRLTTSLIVAVNGLRNRDLSTELIRTNDLTWANFSDILRTREMAESSIRVLRGEISRSERVYETDRAIKTEVARVSDKSSYNRSEKFCYECRSTKHVIRSCPYVKCFSCGVRGHLARYCNERDQDDRYNSKSCDKDHRFSYY